MTKNGECDPRTQQHYRLSDGAVSGAASSPLIMEWMGMAERALYKERDASSIEIRSPFHYTKGAMGAFQTDLSCAALAVLEAVDKALRQGFGVTALRSTTRGARRRTGRHRDAELTIESVKDVATTKSLPSSSSSSSSSFAPSSSSCSSSSSSSMKNRRRQALPLRAALLRSLQAAKGAKAVADGDDPPSTGCISAVAPRTTFSSSTECASAVARTISSSSSSMLLSDSMIGESGLCVDRNADSASCLGTRSAGAADPSSVAPSQREKMGAEGSARCVAAADVGWSTGIRQGGRKGKHGGPGPSVVQVAHRTTNTINEGINLQQLRHEAPDGGAALLQPAFVHNWGDTCMRSSSSSSSSTSSPSPSLSVSSFSLKRLWRMEAKVRTSLGMADAMTIKSRADTTAALEREEEDDEVDDVFRNIKRKRWYGSTLWQVQEESKRRKQGWWWAARTEKGGRGDMAELQRGICDLLQSMGEARRNVFQWLEAIPRSKWGSRTVVTAKHFLAGAVSAAVSRTALAPLERVKLEYLVRGSTAGVGTTIRRILIAEGPLGFWKGNFVNVLRTAPFKSVNFYAFDAARKFLVDLKIRKGDEDAALNNQERLAAGAFAGVAAMLLCFPMDTIRTRLVAKGGENLGGIGGCFQTIVRNEGPLSLYRGLLPGLMSIAPAGAVFYGVCDLLKSSYLKSTAGKAEMAARIKRWEEQEKRRREEEDGEWEGKRGVPTGIRASGQMELGAVRTLLYGAIAGACAETATYPLEVVRRQLQLQGANGAKLGVRRTLAIVVSQGGLPALYVGWLPSTLQVLPSAALSYYVYELMKALMRIP